MCSRHQHSCHNGHECGSQACCGRDGEGDAFLKTLLSPQVLGALIVAIILFLTAKRKIEEQPEVVEPEEDSSASLPERVKHWGANAGYSVGTTLRGR